ncbi:18884_t:CDS:2, partial [Rhizophagus irregularis]
MNSLHTAIISTLEEMNVKKYKNTPRRNNFPLELRQKYNYIHQINSLESLLKNGLFLLSQEFSNEFSATTTEKNELLLNFNHLWRRKSKWIIKIFHMYKILYSIHLFNNSLNSYEDIEHVLINICNLKHHITELIKKERSDWDLQQINFFINRRNDDIKNNQKRALNSILELNSHFKHIGSSDTTNNPRQYDPNLPIREEWAKYYQPKMNIPDDAINKLSNPTTLEAPGPSGITYEMIKQLPDEFLNELIILYNDIIDKGFIPSSWQDALLYPIPKPTWWDNDIQHTRPIVLLDTFRKLLVKVINSRLNLFLSSCEILQHNNRAGTQGSSCMEIILTLQTAIIAANSQKKKLYIMIQDLSKAYDRLNISLLQCALKRICTPEKIITFIINLFTNRKNQVLFEDWIGDAVDDDDPEDVIRESFSAKVLGYLDDTTWLADNLKNLQHNLNIADDFYQFASIKINKRKSVILHNRKLDERMLNLQFESEAVDVKLLPYGQGTRILGVYLSANDSNSTTIAKINSMPVTYKGPRKWFHEKAILSIHPSHSVPTLYAEHWIHVPDTQSQLTPRSRSNILQPCSGCNLHFPYFVGDCQAKYLQTLIMKYIPMAHLRALQVRTNFQWDMDTTKAEILAIVTALIIAPSYSSITIFTDSQAAID